MTNVWLWIAIGLPSLYFIYALVQAWPVLDRWLVQMMDGFHWFRQRHKMEELLEDSGPISRYPDPYQWELAKLQFQRLRRYERQQRMSSVTRHAEFLEAMRQMVVRGEPGILQGIHIVEPEPAIITATAEPIEPVHTPEVIGPSGERRIELSL